MSVTSTPVASLKPARFDTVTVKTTFVPTAGVPLSTVFVSDRSTVGVGVVDIGLGGRREMDDRRRAAQHLGEVIGRQVDDHDAPGVGAVCGAPIHGDDFRLGERVGQAAQEATTDRTCRAGDDDTAADRLAAEDRRVHASTMPS